MTNGATGDIQMATQLARAMIMEWGMSDKLGRVRYNGNEQEVFLGHSVTQSKNLSDDTAKLIDQEIRNLITTGEQKAREILHDKIDALHRVAKGLLEFETLSGEEVKALMRGENIVRRDRQRRVRRVRPTRRFRRPGAPSRAKSRMPAAWLRSPVPDPSGLDPSQKKQDTETAPGSLRGLFRI